MPFKRPRKETFFNKQDIDSSSSNDEDLPLVPIEKKGLVYDFKHNEADSEKSSELQEQTRKARPAPIKLRSSENQPVNRSKFEKLSNVDKPKKVKPKLKLNIGPMIKEDSFISDEEALDNPKPRKMPLKSILSPSKKLHAGRRSTKNVKFLPGPLIDDSIDSSDLSSMEQALRGSKLNTDNSPYPPMSKFKPKIKLAPYSALQDKKKARFAPLDPAEQIKLGINPNKMDSVDSSSLIAE